MLPPKVRLPAPSLFNAPVVVPITPLISVSAAPLIVKFLAAPSTLAPMVKVPASVLICASLAKVIAPFHELVPLMLRSAPAPAIPVPFKVSASAPIVMPPCNSNAAPFATVTPPAAVPAAVAFCKLSTPAFTFTAPVKVLAPVKMTLPMPDFVSVVSVPEITPDTVSVSAALMLMAPKLLAFIDATLELKPPVVVKLTLPPKPFILPGAVLIVPDIAMLDALKLTLPATPPSPAPETVPVCTLMPAVLSVPDPVIVTIPELPAASVEPTPPPPLALMAPLMVRLTPVIVKLPELVPAKPAVLLLPLMLIPAKLTFLSELTLTLPPAPFKAPLVNRLFVKVTSPLSA